MSIYHLSVKPVSRSKGRSSTAAAAYRAGCEIEDKRTGLKHDYTKKQGVKYTEIITPDGVDIPDRANLWNMAEAAERRKDGCTAREYEINLPHELNKAQRTELAQDFCKQLAKIHGIAVDLCIHEPNDREIKAGADPRNHHAHILTTTRKITNDGLTDKADIEKAGRKRKEDLKATRELWADIANEHFKKAGLNNRIDHRSLKDQGSALIPTIKMGKTATQMERDPLYTPKGKTPRPRYETRKGDVNRSIKLQNDINKLLSESLNERTDRADRAIADSKRVITKSIDSIAESIDYIEQSKSKDEWLGREIERTSRAVESTVQRVSSATQGLSAATQSVKNGQHLITKSVDYIEWGNREIEKRVEQKQLKAEQLTKSAIAQRTAFDLIDVRIDLSVTRPRAWKKDPDLSGDKPIGAELYNALDYRKSGYDVHVGDGKNSHIEGNKTAERIKDFMMTKLQNRQVVTDYGNLTIVKFTEKYALECDLSSLKDFHQRKPVEAIIQPPEPPQKQSGHKFQPRNDDYDLGMY